MYCTLWLPIHIPLLHILTWPVITYYCCFFITVLLHHYYALLHQSFLRIITFFVIALLLHHYYVLLHQLLLHIMTFIVITLLLHHYYVLLHYYHYYPLSHVTNWHKQVLWSSPCKLISQKVTVRQYDSSCSNYGANQCKNLKLSMNAQFSLEINSGAWKARIISKTNSAFVWESIESAFTVIVNFRCEYESTALGCKVKKLKNLESSGQWVRSFQKWQYLLHWHPDLELNWPLQHPAAFGTHPPLEQNLSPDNKRN